MATGNRLSGALFAVAACGLILLACAPPQVGSPTAAPAKPAEAARPAEPAPRAEPSPAGPAQPAAPGAVTPAAAAGKPTAQPAAFDERAVADFYRDKFVRIVVGTGAGGLYDVAARLVARQLGKYIPGNPTVVVENRTGAGGLIAYNAIYNTEPKDGTAILSAPPLILHAIMGAEGVAFDPGKLAWLGSADRSFTVCIVRSDLGVKTLQDLMNSRQLALGSLGPGNPTNDVPLVLNAALGTNFKMVAGYETLQKVRLVIQSGEVDGFCPVFSGASSLDRNILEGDNPFARIIGHTSDKTEEHPLLKGAPQAESLAKTEEARLMIRAVDAQNRMTLPYAVPPGIPADRLAALRQALAATLADPQFLADAEQARLPINPNSAEEVEQVVRQLTSVPPEVVAKLKAVLQK